MSYEPDGFRTRTTTISMANPWKPVNFPRKKELRGDGSSLDQKTHGYGCQSFRKHRSSWPTTTLRWAPAKDVASSEALQTEVCDKDRKIKHLGQIGF